MLYPELMAKTSSQFACQSCGTIHSKWSGRCDNCGEWNSIIEEATEAPASGAKGKALPKGRVSKLYGLQGEMAAPPRIETGITELDRVAGGGFVPGSAVLIGGDPGIGKSTLLLQALASLARKGQRVIYVSGEEAIAQVRMRALRLGLADSPVLLASETNTSDIIATMAEGDIPAIVVIELNSNTLVSRHRSRSRHRLSAQGRLRSPGPFCQTERRMHPARRPRDQGWTDCRAKSC